MAIRGFPMERFLERIKDFPSLYNKSSPDYKDSALKEANWKIIAQEFDLPVEECAKKWRNAMDRCVKIQRKIEEGIRDGIPEEAQPKITWSFFPLLRSMLALRRPRRSYAENKGEYIIPNIPDASAPSTSAALDPSSSLILSDVRSLTDLAEDTQIQIKEEIVEESMEEEEEEHVLVSEVPPSPSSATTSFTIPPFAGPSTSAATAQLLTLSESPLVQVVTNTVPMVVPSAPTDTPPMLPPVGQSTPQLQEPQETPVPMTTSTPEARAGPKSFALTRKRQATPWTPPSIADRKAKVELELLQAKKKKLEAEERKAIAETQRMAEERKKFEEEQKKLRAEADFYLQERIRSAEETKKATAIAEYHFEEKRKASAKADMLIEHKRFYIEQQKTEIIRRKMLMFELRKMKQDLKLVAQ
ncbi:uncharacterized protein LOC135388112 isoform X3 [Ornithodoros turicata]|uniref:uncharacterized protein LOC135388112 isoform X3 n=1 Tax=Ornithodoros turicata TaxID=34597 RepID=UPI00313A0533